MMKTLKQNYILGLDREDLLQEIKLVLWECFVKGDINHFPTYLSRSIHNRVTDLYAESQRYYYPSTKLRCLECKLAVSQKPKKCPDCGGVRWRVCKGKPLLPLFAEDSPTYNLEEGVIDDYPEEIREIISKILDGHKTGRKQKEKVREYILNEWY